jgi:hypothetical protein
LLGFGLTGMMAILVALGCCTVTVVGTGTLTVSVTVTVFSPPGAVAVVTLAGAVEAGSVIDCVT